MQATFESSAGPGAFSMATDYCGVASGAAARPGKAARAAARMRLKASHSTGFCLIVRLSWRRVRMSVASGQPRSSSVEL